MIRRRPSEDGFGERSVSELPAISLFSGAGGLDLGVERAGYRVLASVEYEPDAAATLRANFPHAQVLQRDIRSVPTAELLDAAGLRPGEAELLVGGPPCTPFSKSGNWLEYKRTGKDANADLLDHYLRILAETKPRAFLLENVFGLAYRNHNAFWLKRLLTMFRELGYDADHRILLAADYGVPQRRQRLFILGSRGQPRRAAVARTRVEDRGYEVAGYLASYLLPFVTPARRPLTPTDALRTV
jgi:DNA (cytosine-5)-methyltransferase 1